MIKMLVKKRLKVATRNGARARLVRNGPLAIWQFHTAAR